MSAYKKRCKININKRIVQILRARARVFIKEVNLFPKNSILFIITFTLFPFLIYTVFYIVVRD